MRDLTLFHPLDTLNMLNRACTGANKDSSVDERSHSFQSGVSRSASSVEITLDDSSTNETTATTLCNPSIATLNELIVHSITTHKFWLPDCFFPLAYNMQTLFLSSFIIAGNSSTEDPLQRLGKAAPALISFTFTNGVLLDQHNTSTTLSWGKLINSMPSVSRIDMSGTPLRTTLPSDFPGIWRQMSFANTQLLGSIPSTLLMAYSSVAISEPTWSLDLSHNNLNDTLPNLLAAWDLSSYTPTYVRINLANNQLGGTFPTGFSASNIATLSFALDISGNKFSGPLSNIFADHHNMVSTQYLLINASSNGFTGSIFPAFTLKSPVSLALDFSNNGLQGLLPASYFTSLGLTDNPDLIALNVAGNKFSGSMPFNFLELPAVTSGGTLLSAKSWSISVSHNLLNQAIPNEIWSGLNWASTETAEFNFESNLFEGGLPARFVGTSLNDGLRSISVSVSNNLLMKGSIPPSFILSIFAGPTNSTLPRLSVLLAAASTGLQGTLDFQNYNLRIQKFNLDLYLANSNLSSIKFDGATGALRNLDVRNNALLTGTIPDSLFAAPSILASLQAGGTSLSGTLPDMAALPGSSVLTTLDLANTDIDFCYESRATWTSSSLTSCNLGGTNAASCANTYPSGCLASPPLVAPSVAPLACSNATKPIGNDWRCVGSTWVFYGSIETPTLTIPAGAAETIVRGNITSSEIIISGVGSTLVITEGCATNLTSLTIELTKSDLEKLGSSKTQSLLLIDSSCETDLNGVSLGLKVKESSCKKATAKKVASASELSVIFSVDSSDCRTWWIILTAVLASVVVIAIIVVVLLAIFVPAVRVFFRPHSKKRAPVV